MTYSDLVNQCRLQNFTCLLNLIYFIPQPRMFYAWDLWMGLKVRVTLWLQQTSTTRGSGYSVLTAYWAPSRRGSQPTMSNTWVSVLIPWGSPLNRTRSCSPSKRRIYSPCPRRKARAWARMDPLEKPPGKAWGSLPGKRMSSWQGRIPWPLCQVLHHL